MKKLLFAVSSLLVLNLAVAQDFTVSGGTPSKKRVIYKTAARPVGSFSRVAQAGGNPLQLLNPGAPAAYGEGGDHVTENPGQVRTRSLTLFGFEF